MNLAYFFAHKCKLPTIVAVSIFGIATNTKYGIITPYTYKDYISLKRIWIDKFGAR